MPSAADGRDQAATATRRVILLHGPPACGKLTIARCLAERLDAVVLHNHLTFNLARTLFAIGDQRLPALHRQLRLIMLEHALAPTPEHAEPVPDLILTLVYTDPESVPNFADIIQRVDASGATLHPFYLSCSEQALLERVVAAGREKEGKLHNPTRLAAMLAQNSYPPLPDPRTRTINNETISADAAATEILEHLEQASGRDQGERT